ncbi:MAG: peptidase, partial [Verrucomicrobia bacterium]|nr:peptidase [Verrucomicrobiota bacterium]
SGMVRARYRTSLKAPAPIVAGETMRYVIRMGPTSIQFRKGHRLRLDVTSSDFPNYDRNHNTAADQNVDARLVPAEQTVFHGGARASRLVVPVITSAATRRK